VSRAGFSMLPLLAVLAGCAGDPAPHAQLRLSEQALAQAGAVGADPSQDAFALAQSRLELAGTALAAGRNREARLLAEQAELDARLAEAQVLAQKSRAQVDERERKVGLLRRQLGEVR